jgi:two-component system sensor histidine kinase HydH
MFRPAREHSRFGYVPLRLVASVFSLFALLLGIAVVVGMQYEQRLVSSKALTRRDVSSPALLSSLALGDLLKTLAVLLFLAAVGILFFTTFQNYRVVTKTFERVKSHVRNILQSIPTGVLTLDSRGVVTALNNAAERLLGLRASVIVGRSVDEVLHAAPALAAWLRGALAGERLIQETELELTADGGRRVTVRASASELRDEAGRPDGLVVLLRDTTEVSRLELQLRRTDKLAALGTLAAGVAHEVKNPLHALTLNLHLLQAELAAPDPSAAETKGYFGILRSEMDRIHHIVENFLRFSKPSIPEVTSLNPHALLERVLSLTAFEAADHGVSIVTQFDPTLDSLLGDDGQLSQVFLNIVINALQAMPSGGTLMVTTQRAGDWAEITVRDSGEGIQREILPHVFDPYFTTRPRGVGLGLAIAHRIVEGHQGTIDVESEVGKGTTMIIRLPRANQFPVGATP